MNEITIDSINIFPIPQKESSPSLVGFGSCIVNNCLRLSGLALHITREGKLKIVWPAKSVGRGFVFYNQPLSSEVSEKFRLAFENKATEVGLFNLTEEINAPKSEVQN